MMLIDDLSVSLGGKVVIEHLTASLSQGRFTAIIGPNGAGKSSLMRSMAGLLSPLRGQIRLDGNTLHEMPATERARKIGYLAQDSKPAWALSVHDLVSLGRTHRRSLFAAPDAADEAAIRSAIVEADISHLTERAVDTLSGGELGRALIARVLAGEPAWILADEPFASLDIPHRQAVLALFQKLAANGRGVVAIVHQLEAACEADDVMILSSGQLIAFGPRQEVLTAANLEAAFGMGFAIHHIDDRQVILTNRA